MIEFEGVSVTYAGAPVPVWSDATFTLEPGALHLVVGPTGSGKSTLLGLLNGHVPHFTGGLVAGRVTVAGCDLATHRPREFACTTGVVRQNPRTGFVAATVRDEVVYAMENLGFSRPQMVERLDEVVAMLRIGHLLDRSLASLSGGQAQRVAIAAALVAGPSVVVLDEPTSGLDPDAAHEVLTAIVALVEARGLTAVVSEHRLERVLDLARRVVVVEGGTVTVAPPREAMAFSTIVPPVVEVARGLAWAAVPLTVAEAAQSAGPLLRLLDAAPAAPLEQRDGMPVATLDSAAVTFDGVQALAGISTTFRSGEVVALMGRNGAGKSTTLGTLCGLVALDRGACTVGGSNPLALTPRALVRVVGLIPQDPGLLLYASTVRAECEGADRDAGLTAGTTAAWFARFQPTVELDRHPRDLSEGQRLCLSLAVVAAAEPPLLLLDEPTCGLDNLAKVHLAEVLADQASRGTAIVVASHDVEFVAEVAHRVVVLDHGAIVDDGDPTDVLGRAPYPPQVATLVAPRPFMTAASVLTVAREAT